MSTISGQVDRESTTETVDSCSNFAVFCYTRLYDKACKELFWKHRIVFESTTSAVDQFFQPLIFTGWEKSKAVKIGIYSFTV